MSTWVWWLYEARWQPQTTDHCKTWQPLPPPKPPPPPSFKVKVQLTGDLLYTFFLLHAGRQAAFYAYRKSDLMKIWLISSSPPSPLLSLSPLCVSLFLGLSLCFCRPCHFPCSSVSLSSIYVFVTFSLVLSVSVAVSVSLSLSLYLCIYLLSLCLSLWDIGPL